MFVWGNSDRRQLGIGAVVAMVMGPMHAKDTMRSTLLRVGTVGIENVVHFFFVMFHGLFKVSTHVHDLRGTVRCITDATIFVRT